MRKTTRNIFEDWQQSFIRDVDLAQILGRTDDARYAIVKRALKSGSLVHLRKGLYLIASKVKQRLPDVFELALLIYSPSIISLESALAYHGWIPEAVYTTTCVTPKRAQEFKTPFGVFTYKRVPECGFYVGVTRVSRFLIAEPWKALADFMYTRHKSWNSLDELEADLRIDRITMEQSDLELLKELSEYYPSLRVRKGLKKILGALL